RQRRRLKWQFACNYGRGKGDLVCRRALSPRLCRVAALAVDSQTEVCLLRDGVGSSRRALSPRLCRAAALAVDSQTEVWRLRVELRAGGQAGSQPASVPSGGFSRRLGVDSCRLASEQARSPAPQCELVC